MHPTAAKSSFPMAPPSKAWSCATLQAADAVARTVDEMETMEVLVNKLIVVFVQVSAAPSTHYGCFCLLCKASDPELLEHMPAT